MAATELRGAPDRTRRLLGLLLLATVAVLWVDARTPRPEGWPPPLLSRADLDHWLSGAAFRGESAPSALVDEPAEPPAEPDEALPPEASLWAGPTDGDTSTETATSTATADTTLASGTTGPMPVRPLPPGPRPAVEVPADDPRWSGFAEKVRGLAARRDGKLRVVHLGDSEIAGDRLASDFRTALESRLGAGGPGFALPGKAWHWYYRNGFEAISATGFVESNYARYFSREGENFGPGGIAWISRVPGSRLRVQLARPPAGECSVDFLYAPAAGLRFDVVRDDGTTTSVDGAAAEGDGPVKRWRQEAGPCPRRVEVVLRQGTLRAFGWNVETPSPGVVWSSMGVVGSTATHLGHYSGGSLGASLAALEADLVVATYGLNTVAVDWTPPPSEPAQLRRVIDELRALRPGAACVFMTPYPVVLSRGGRRPSPTTARLAAMVRRQAWESGCLFIDREQQAGGPAAGLDWMARKPRLLSGDNVHLTDAGAAVVGKASVDALLSALFPVP